VIKSKQIGVLFSIAYSILLYSWLYHVYDIYYRFELIHQVGLAALLASAMAISWLSPKVTISPMLIMILLVGITLSAHPVISFAVIFFNKTWVIVHFFAFLGGLLIGQMRYVKWLILPFIAALCVWFIPFEIMGGQRYHSDKLIESIEVELGEAEITRWKNGYWLYYNKKLQFSTLDKHVLAEAFTLPAAHIEIISRRDKRKNVLILGGENHLIANELLKFSDIESVTVLPYDMAYYEFVQSNIEVLGMSHSANNSKTNLITNPQLFNTEIQYDLIYLDPPVTSDFSLVDLDEAVRLMSDSGVLVLSMGNPYLAPEKTTNIQRNLSEYGFSLLNYHTQVPTLGEMSWVLCNRHQASDTVKAQLMNVIPKVKTIWWNQEAMQMMLSYGKAEYFDKGSLVYLLGKL